MHFLTFGGVHRIHQDVQLGAIRQQDGVQLGFVLRQSRARSLPSRLVCTLATGSSSAQASCTQGLMQDGRTDPLDFCTATDQSAGWMHARPPGLVPEAWELPLDRAKQEALWKPQQHFGTAAAAADPHADTAVTAPGRASVGGKRSAAELDGVAHQVSTPLARAALQTDSCPRSLRLPDGGCAELAIMFHAATFSHQHPPLPPNQLCSSPTSGGVTRCSPSNISSLALIAHCISPIS